MLAMSKNDLFEELLDVLPFCVYIADMANYTLLYANRQMQEALGSRDLAGRKCYNYIYNCSSPCPLISRSDSKHIVLRQTRCLRRSIHPSPEN